jgi:hypothetical protein
VVLGSAQGQLYILPLSLIIFWYETGGQTDGHVLA